MMSFILSNKSRRLKVKRCVLFKVTNTEELILVNILSRAIPNMFHQSGTGIDRHSGAFDEIQSLAF